MKLSIYTAVKDGIANDLHVEAMLKHHLPLADEIIVNEGYSTDDTYDRVTKIDPKIRVFRSEWEKPKDIAWCVGFKDAARRACSGDWCIHLDCDEFIPEWEFEPIRSFLGSTNDVMVPVRFVNFYGNYQVFHAEPAKVSWPYKKMIIHRNLDDIEFWGDGSNVRLKGRKFTWETSEREFTVHHFGMVRDPGVLRHKWWIQGRAVLGKSMPVRPPRFLFKLFPHEWADAQFLGGLQIYPGPHIAAVNADPKEFIRDELKLVDVLRRRGASGAASGR